MPELFLVTEGLPRLRAALRKHRARLPARVLVFTAPSRQGLLGSYEARLELEAGLLIGLLRERGATGALARLARQCRSSGRRTGPDLSAKDWIVPMFRLLASGARFNDALPHPRQPEAVREQLRRYCADLRDCFELYARDDPQFGEFRSIGPTAATVLRERFGVELPRDRAAAEFAWNWGRRMRKNPTDSRQE